MNSQLRIPLRRQHGLGLVEVMIGMAIGLVLLGGVGYLFVGSHAMNATQADTVRMRESGRNAMEVVGRALRSANFRLYVDGTLGAPALDGTDGAGTGVDAPADILVVRHDPARATGGAPEDMQGSETNCEGDTVTASVVPDPATGQVAPNMNMVQYRFSVVGGSLVCQADPTKPTSDGVVVAENVENMQISYGIGDGAETVLRYVDSPSALEYAQVAAVRVSLLLRGPTKGLAVGGQKVNYNGVEETKNDGYLRQVVTSTFTVRNQARW